jgi:hypothetical protein
MAVKRLAQVAAMKLTREELLMKLGSARSQAPTAWRLVNLKVDPDLANFSYALNRNKLAMVRRREGRYLLRTNLSDSDPAKLWELYVTLVKIEEAFKNLKSDLALRRSSISARIASRRIFSSPSSPIACMSRWTGGCMRWHPVSVLAASSKNSPPCR